MNITELIKKLNLPKYHTRVLSNLILLRKSKATELAKIADIPRTRIYDVLEDLFKIGLVRKKPGRPTIYYSINPKDIAKNLIIWKKRKLKEEVKKFKILENEIKEATVPEFDFKSKELLNIVQVGAPSEIETKRIINKANVEIDIVSRAFEYYGSVRDSLTPAHNRNVKIKILLLNNKFMNEKDTARQEIVKKWITRDLPKAKIKISKHVLPIRATIVDANKNYLSGSAIFLVEQKEVPLFLREAVITTNPALVYGLKIYFDNLWKVASVK